MQRIILKDLAYARPPRYRDPYPRDNWPARVAGCFYIAAAFTAFFWIYGLTFHREDAAFATSDADTFRQTRTATSLVAPWAPAPDMNSPAIQYANSDVTDQAAKKPPDTKPEIKRVTAEREVPIKHHQAVGKRLPDSAANSYASANHYSRPQVGGSNGW
jgi:hypothetical protein